MDAQHAEQMNLIDAELRKCTTRLEAHLADTQRHVEGVQHELTTMRENHLAHIQRATELQADSSIAMERKMGEMRETVTLVRTNQEWLMRYHWIVATASIGALIAGVINLIQ